MIEDWLKGSRSNFDFNIKFMTRSINNFIDSLVESNKFESYKKRNGIQIYRLNEHTIGGIK